MLALSTAGPGRHTNSALVTGPDGEPLAPPAEAVIELLAEAIFDCGEIIGTVFDDANGNGYKDEGEAGLPGVRLATVSGTLITTDEHGRFHLPCAALPDQHRLELHPEARRAHPADRLRVTTDNPEVVRLTAGKMTELNFGASIGRVVRLDLQSGLRAGRPTCGRLARPESTS